MRKNLLCPNLKHPHAQVWITRLGVRGFYRKYIESGYDIPSPYEDSTNINLGNQTITVQESLANFLTANPHLNEGDYNLLIERLNSSLEKPTVLAELLGALQKGRLTREQKQAIIAENQSKIIANKESLTLQLRDGSNQSAQIIKYLDGTHVVFYTDDNGRNKRMFSFKDSDTNSIDKWIEKYYNGALDRQVHRTDKANESVIKKLNAPKIVESVDTTLANQIKALYKLFMVNNHYNDLQGFEFNRISGKTASDFASFVESLSQTSNETIEDMILINKELFTAIQESEIVDNIVAEMYGIINRRKSSDLKLNLKAIFDETYDQFGTYMQAAKYKAAHTDNPDHAAKFAKLAERFENVFKHFDSFYTKAINKLNSVGFKVKDHKAIIDMIAMSQNEFGDNVDDSGDLDSAEALYRKLDYSDEANFAMSAKDTASAHLRQALSMVPVYTRDVEGNLTQNTEKSYLGALPVYEGIDTIWGELIFKLHNVPIGKKLDYLKNSGNIRLQKIAEIIESNPNTRIRNEFESAFSKQRAEFVTVKISKPDNNEIRTFDVFNTNRNNSEDILFDDWHDNFLNKDNFYVEKEDGSRKITQDYLNAYYALDKALNDYKGVKTLTEDKKLLFSNLFENLKPFGIEVSSITINSLLSTNNLNTLNSVYRNIDTIKNSLFDPKTKIGDYDTLNPFYSIEDINDDKISVMGKASYNIKALAKLEDTYNPVTFEASFITGDGKSKYSYVNNSYLTHQFEKLHSNPEYVNRLSKTAFAKHSLYLNKLIKDPQFKSRFKLSYFDTMGNNSMSHIRNKKFKDMTDKEKEVLRISLYMNNGIHMNENQTYKGTGKFISLINSDKTTHPVMDVPKFALESTFYNNNGQVGFNLTDYSYESVIRPLYMAERARIYATNAKNDILKNGDPKAIRNYHKDKDGNKGLGSKFIIFPGLNEIVLDSNGNLKPEVEVEQSVKDYLKGFFNDIAIDQLRYWKASGITPKLITNKHYNRNLTGKTSTLDVKTFAEFGYEYAVNQFIFMQNQMQLFSGDIALHDKGKPEAAWVNFFKRMAKDIAPGLDYNFGEGSTYNTIVIEDFKKASKHLDQYNKLLTKTTAEAYGKNPKGIGQLNIADAQEYTTLDEHIAVMKAGGRLDDTPEVTAAIERLRNGTNTNDDIRLILPPFQPQKPVYAEMVVPDGSEVAEVYYIKSSSIPLIPSLTIGTPLDKLRLLMENHKDADGNPRPINRAAFESAVKLGTKGSPISLFNDNGDISLTSINDAEVYNLPRSGFRIQMEIPNHGTDGSITEGTQARKLIYNNMLNDDVSLINGEEYSNKDIKSAFNRLHYHNMIDGYRSVLKDLGYDSTGKLINPSKMVNFLKDEAISKDYSINDINSIQIVYEGGQFKLKMPLALNQSGEKFQAMLNSLITNRVIKKDLPGFTAVQASSAGFQLTDMDTYAANYDSANITYVNPNDTELTFARVTKDSGKDIITIDETLLSKTSNGIDSLEHLISLIGGYPNSTSDITINGVNYYLPQESHVILYGSNKKQLTLKLYYKNKEYIIGKNNEDGPNFISNFTSIPGTDFDVLTNLKSYLDSNPNLDVHPYRVNFKAKLSPEDQYRIKNYIANRYASVIEADIIVPNYFGDINIKDYISQDGTLDTDRIPEELLTVIGIRIPTQGHNSMLKFKVKGFLSHVNGEMAIVPEEIVAQMGSDFDVDKLFIYRYEYKNKEGNFTKIGKNINDILSGKVDIAKLSVAERNNAIIDMMAHKLSEGAVIHSLLMPNGFGALPDILQEIKEYTPNLNKHYFTTRAQNNIHSVNNDGKVGVAVFSLFSTFNRKLQDVDSIGFTDMNLTIGGKKIGDLGGLFDINGNMRSDVIMYLQSAAVDNAKEQILGVLNINDKTINIAGTMALLGLDEYYISYILAQPVVKEVIAEISNNNDITGTGSVFANLDQVIQDKLSEMASDLQEDPSGDINLEELRSNFKNRESITDSKVLIAFNQFRKAAQQLSNVMGVLNIDSGGLGSTFAATMAKKMRIESLNTPNIGTDVIPYGFDDLFADKTDPAIVALNVLDKSIELFSQVYDFYSPEVTETLLALQRQFNLNLNEENIKTIYNSLKAYLYSDSTLLDEDTLAKVRYDLLYSPNNIAVRFSKWAKRKGNKNLIARRIKPRKASKAGMPNTIITVNTKASNSSEDVNKVTSHFYAMLTSTDKVERQLAEDMVKYFYLTGGSFSPTSIGKYLNNDILDKYNFSQKIRNGMDSYKSDLATNRGSFLMQLFQNNPRLISSGLLKDAPATYKQGTLKFQNINESPIISLYDDGKAKAFRLFVRQSPKIYYEIPTINEGKGISHYEFAEDLTFNQVDIPSISQRAAYSKATLDNLNKGIEGYNDIVSYSIGELDVEVEPNPQITGVDAARNIFGYFEGANPKDVVNNVANNESVPQYLRNLARDIRDNFGDLDKVTFGYATGVRGSMSKLNLKINANVFKKIADAGGPTFEHSFAETFIHEMLHGVTAFYLNPSNIGTLNATQQKAVQRIHKLRELHMRNYPDQAKLQKFLAITTEIYNATVGKRKINLTEAEKAFFNNNKDELYGYTDVYEFVSEGLSNPEFRKSLENKNFWTRFLDALKNLLGFGSTDLDVLYNSTLDLMPFQRPDFVSSFKSTPSDMINNNSAVEQGISRVLDNLNNQYSKQIDAFVQEYNLNSGSELYTGRAIEINNELIDNPQYKYLQVQSVDGKLEFFMRDFPKILDIRKAVSKEISNTDVNFDVGKVAEEAEKQRNYNLLDKFSMKYLTLLRQRRDRLKAKIKAQQNQFGTLNQMEAEYEQLRRIIRDLQSRLSDDDGTVFPKVIEYAEQKLSEIEALEKTGGLNADNISEAIKYINTISTFNDRLNVKESSEYKEKLDNLSIRGLTLHKKLLAISSKILDNEINKRLGMSLETYQLITEGVKDITMMSAEFLDFSNINNKYIQSLGYLIEKFQFNATLEIQEFSDEFSNLIEEYYSKYNVKDLEEFLQTNKGNWTGNFLTKFSGEYYEGRKDLKFRRDNTQLILTQDNLMRWQNDAKHIKENFPDQYEQWLKTHDLEKYRKRWNKMKVSNGNNPTAKYFVEKPLDKWIDPKWNEINSLPDSDPKKKLYIFMRDNLREINSRYYKEAGYLGDVSKTTSELLLEGKIKSAAKSEAKVITDLYNDEGNIISRDLDVITGDIQRNIPIYLMDGELTASDKTRDIAKIIEAMKSQEISLKYKYEAEPILMLYQHLINNASTVTDAKRSNDSSETLVIESRPQKLSEYSLFMIQNFLYNTNRDSSDSEKKYGKWVDAGAHYLRVKGMGWNPFSMFGNMMQSLTNNLALSVSNKYFNNSDYNYGLAKALNVFTSSKEAKKVEALMDKFDLVPLVSELQFNKSRILGKLGKDKLSALAPLYLTQKAEEFNTAHTMIAILSNMKVTDKNGKSVPIYDAFDENGKFDSENYGENPLDDKENLFKQRMIMRKAIIEVHGNYVRPIMAKKNFMKRTLLIFRTWLPQAVNSRFGAYVHDEFTGIETEGRYRTVFDLIKSGKLKSAFRDAFSKDATTLSALQVGNFRRTLAELAMITALFGFALMLKHLVDWDDMDDEEKASLVYLMNTMNRAQTDLLALMDPKEFMNIMKSPTSLFSIVDDVYGVMGATVRTVTGDPLYQTGSREGQSVLVKEIMDLIPFATQIDKNFSYSQNLFSDRR